MICPDCYEQYNTGRDIVEIRAIANRLYDQIIKEELDAVTANRQLKTFCCEKLNLKEVTSTCRILKLIKKTKGALHASN